MVPTAEIGRAFATALGRDVQMERIHPVCDAGSSRGGGDVDVPPVPGQEFIQVRCGMISDAAQDIGQPGAGIDVVQLSCCDQRVHGGGALPAAI